MKCQKCVAKVTELIGQFPQIASVSVSLEHAEARITPVDEQSLPLAEIRTRLQEAGFSCEQEQGPQAGTDEDIPETENPVPTSRFRISGMSCSNCAATIEKGVAALEDVIGAQVNFAAEILTVEHADKAGMADVIRRKVSDLGYSAAAEGQSDQLRFAIEGMSCASCAATIEKKLRQLPGLTEVQVNLAGNFGQARFDPRQLTEDEILNAVSAAGYHAVRIVQGAKPRDDSRRELYWVLFSAAGTLPIILLMFQPLFGSATVYINALLATILQFSAGWCFYRGAYKSLRNRSANMDVLVALGISAAYGYSLLAVSGLLGADATIFFETSAMLILFIRFGKWLESRAKGRAGAALKKLLQLQADRAVLLDGDLEREVPASQVKSGDLLLVRPGEKIPVDGVVVEGSAAVDEAMISGEAVPVAKEQGSTVTGATINRSGRLVIRATHVGDETVLAQIVRLVEEAQADKAPIQRLADRVSAYFVPVVISLSLLTFFVWFLLAGSNFLFAFQMAIAVVVIACPCALGLATPTAIMVGSSVGLERGILFKKATVLEQISKLEVLLLDKTGTLTTGTFQVDELVCFAAGSEEELLRSAAAIEAASNHPLAQGIVSAARQRQLDWSGVVELEEFGGQGLRGVVDGAEILCGNQNFLKGRGIDLDVANSAIKKLAAAGKSLVFLARDSDLQGFIALSDGLKPNAARAMQRLRALSLQTVLLTGDRRQAAQAVAAGLGIDTVEAEVLPEQKLQVVKKYQQEGRLVGMVGDGINDAPALARADIGIAIGSGTDVAKETGDLILVGGDLFDIERGIRLGRLTLRKIKQNLFWAFIYNLLGIPLAAGVFYPLLGLYLKPEFAGLAMAFSSVSVVSNSLLLRRVKQPLQDLK